MNERDLQIFRTVCQCGSMSQAAELLDMSQPAVSLTIRDLESYYGVKLFERANRKITMTEEGETLLNYADSILSQYEEVKQVLSEKKEVAEVHFGVNITIGETILPDLLKKLEKKYPSTSFNVEIQDNEAISDAVLRSEIDFGITDDTEKNIRLDYTDLYSEKMTAVLAKKDKRKKISLKDLDQKPVLLREKGSGNRALMEEVFEKGNIHPVIKVQSLSDEVLVMLAEKGEGIAFLPESYAEKAVSSHNIRLLQIRELNEKRHYHIIARHNRWISSSMKEILQSVVDYAHV